jgi:phospholipid/cholesterol/gamma-HCH transport system permease protein
MDRPEVEFHVDDGGRAVLTVRGTLDVDSAPRVRDQVATLCARAAGRLRSLEIDARGLERADMSGMAVLHDLAAGVRCGDVEARVRGLRPELERLLAAFPDGGSVRGASPPRPPVTRAVPEAVGSFTVRGLRSARAQVEFMGSLVEALVLSDRRSRIRWPEVSRIFIRSGVDALPIVLLVSFLTGLVIAFESAGPFSRYGAKLLIADTIGLAMTRELGPLMTAVIFAGRSGSAFAAELGIMKVNEELDALATMGLDPVRFLVLQRILAAVLLTPLLTVYAMGSGILGGFVVMWTLGFSTVTVWTEMLTALRVADLLFGLGKGVVFGATIAIIGCHRGMRTGPGPTAVGEAATSAVVSGLVMVTVIDCLFAFLRSLYVE